MDYCYYYRRWIKSLPKDFNLLELLRIPTNEWTIELARTAINHSNTPLLVLEWLIKQGIWFYLGSFQDQVEEAVYWIQVYPGLFKCPTPFLSAIQTCLCETCEDPFSYIPRGGIPTRRLINLYNAHRQFFVRTENPDFESTHFVGHFVSQLSEKLGKYGSKMSQTQLACIANNRLACCNLDSLFILLNREHWPLWMLSQHWKGLTPFELEGELPQMWTSQIAKAFFEVTYLIRLIPHKYRNGWMEGVLLEHNKKAELANIRQSEFETLDEFKARLPKKLRLLRSVLPTYYQQYHVEYSTGGPGSERVFVHKVTDYWSDLQHMGLLATLMNKWFASVPYLWSPTLRKSPQHRRTKMRWTKWLAFEQDC